MLELLDALLGIIATGQFLKVITDKLIEALAEGVSLLSSACDKLLINRQSHVHGHSICAHVSCVKLEMITSGTPSPLLHCLPVYVASHPSNVRLIGFT